MNMVMSLTLGVLTCLTTAWWGSVCSSVVPFQVLR